MTACWKYLESRDKKHYFYESDRTVAACGATKVWYNPEPWKFDEKGLKERKPCGRCVKIVK